ncbi:hypothetical protein VNI00_018962 [Paramarasmius palmivorus]|uniref:Uncharacterized protein n=1 Tax=Paramarasmius palmivorus TaxID=297713 RepID=A0AAW0AVR4_9AGAR
MPWAKVPKSVATKRKENREKSARHYARHRDDILARKKAAREQKAKQADGNRSDGRTRGGVKDSAGTGHMQAPHSSRGIESQERRLQNALTKHTEGDPVSFLDRLYHRYISHRVTALLEARQVLESAESQINTLIKYCYEAEAEVLQRRGANEEYRRVQSFSKRVKCILDCIVDMEMFALDPDEDLERAYLERRLQFQKTPTQGWLNGTVSIPE